jgi:serine/threonine protein kinase
MGEVYRAHDAKLKRDVALKILPAHGSRDVERLARFEREARVLASLNHPHIATIYGVDETDGVRALILELVEGPTLAERQGRGPLPVREALSAARQIAEALDAAHEKGIVHRDLKSASRMNVHGEMRFRRRGHLGHAGADLDLAEATISFATSARRWDVHDLLVVL